MAGIRIGQLSKQSEFNMDDLLLVEQKGVTKCATIENLKKVMKGEPGVLINDDEVSEETVWSSDKMTKHTNEKIQENIQDGETSEETVWSSNKVATHVDEKIQENIQDNDIAENTVWSSTKVDTFTGEHYKNINVEKMSEKTHTGFLKNFEIHGNTVRGKGLSHMPGVGDKVEGRDLFRITLSITNGLDASHKNYEERTLSILTPVQLEKVGEVPDRIICRDGIWGVDKRINTKVIDNAKWVVSGQSLTTTPNLNFDKSALGEVTELLMSNLEVCSEEDLHVGSAFGIGYRPSTDTLRVRLRGVKSEFELNQWLHHNPLIVKYPTADRKFIPLPYDQQAKLRTFAGMTTIEFKTSIKGTVSAQVPTSIYDMVVANTEQLSHLDDEIRKIRGLEVTDAPKHTINGSIAIVDETPKGYFNNVRIQGRTEHNLLLTEGSFGAIGNYVLQGGATAGTVANKELKFTVSAGASGGYDGKVRIIPRKDTPYTIVYDINPTTSDTNGYIKVVVGEGEERKELITYRGEKGGNGYQRYTTVIDPGILCGQKEFYLHYGATTTAENDIVTFRGIMVLEGDRRDSVPMEHFDGSKYVGEGASAMYIETYDPEDKKYNYIREFTLGTDDFTLNDQGVRVGDTTSNYCRNFIRVSPNTTYTLRLAGQQRIYFFDRRKYWIGRSELDERFIVTFTTPEDCYFIQIQYLKASVTDINFPFVMTKGEELCADHEFGISDRKHILYFNHSNKTWNNPVLRAFDSLEKHDDGRCYYHQRSAVVTLSGAEAWVLFEPVETRENTVSFALEVNYTFPNSRCDANRLPTIASNEPFTDDLECMKISPVHGTGRNSYIYINIRKDRLASLNTAGIQAWIKANPIIFTYEMYTERMYECTGLDMRCFDGKTAYTVEYGIPSPVTTVTVNGGISNVITSLQGKVAALEGLVSRLVHDIR